MADVKIKAVLEAEDKASAKVQGFSMSLGKLAGAVGIGTIAANAFQKGLSFLTGTIKDSLKAGREQEVAMAKVGAILKTLNIESTKTAAAIEKAGKAALKMGFDDEAGALAAAKLLQVTKDVKIANEGLGVAMDLARMKNIDLESASQALTLAFMGNTRLLKQLGIDVPENATKLQLLGLVHEKVAGQAEAFGKTAAGAQAILAENIMNVKEQFGAALAKGMQPFIAKLTEWISKPETQIFITNLATKLGQLMTTLMTIAEKVMPIVVKAWNGLENAIAAVIIGLDKLQDAYAKVKNFAGEKGSDIKGGLGGLFNILSTGTLEGRRAAGGYISSGKTYLVGERGPELFTSNGSGNITPNNKIGGSNITVNINGSVSDNNLQTIISEIKRVLNREQVVAGLRI